MVIGKSALGALLALGGATCAFADPARVVLSCSGETIRDYKSLNLPSKTTPETRIYVLDQAQNSVSTVTQGEVVPLCDKDKPGCRVDFVAAGVHIGYKADNEALEFVFNRGKNAIQQQDDNAALTTTFEGSCKPADLSAPAK